MSVDKRNSARVAEQFRKEAEESAKVAAMPVQHPHAAGIDVSLVPKLRLGTHFAKLRFAFSTDSMPLRSLSTIQVRSVIGSGCSIWRGRAKRSFAECVPKRSLGTR